MKTRALGVIALAVAAGLSLGCMGKRRAGAQKQNEAAAKAKDDAAAAQAAVGAKDAPAEAEAPQADGAAKADAKAAQDDRGKTLAVRGAMPDKGTAEDMPELRDGDIVFQQAQRKWEQAVTLATADEWTHTGVIIWTEGAPHVVEVTKSLWQERFDKWRKRGHGRVVVKRLKNIDEKLTEDNDRQFKLSAVQHRSKPYDFAFEWSEDKLYAAELVHIMFQSIGVELGKRTAMKDLQKDATAAAKLEELYGEKIPPDREILTISSIFDDPQLETVWDSAAAMKAAAGGSRG